MMVVRMMSSSVLTWPASCSVQSNALLRQVFDVYKGHHDIPDDVVFGDLFTRLSNEMIRFFVSYMPKIGFTIDGTFICQLSKSPIDGTWYGEIVMRDVTGCMTGLPVAGDWFAVSACDGYDEFRLAHAILSELAWLNLDNPDDHVVILGSDFVLVSPLAVELLDHRLVPRDVAEYQAGRRRVCSSLALTDTLPVSISSDLQITDSDGSNVLFRCSRVGPDGMWL